MPVTPQGQLPAATDGNRRGQRRSSPSAQHKPIPMSPPVKPRLGPEGGDVMTGITQRLQNRLPSEQFKLTHNTVTVSRFPRLGGEIAELFIDSNKHSAADANAQDAAIVFSIARRGYGVPIDIIRRALLRDEKGRGSTPLGHALDALRDGAAS